MLSRKQRLKAFLRKHFVPVDSPIHSPSPGGSAGPSPPHTRTSSRPATPRSHHPPSGVTVADRPITQPRERRRRRRRRTASPVGLPLYSVEPQAQEMSIFKSQDMAASGLDLSLSRATTGERSYAEGESDLDGEGDEAEEARGEDGVEDEEDEHSFFARPSIDISADGQARRSSFLLTPPQTIGRPRSASEPLGAGGAAHRARSGSNVSGAAARSGRSPYLSHSPGGSSPFASRSGLIDVPIRPPSPPSAAAAAPTPNDTSPLPTPSRPSFFSHRSSRSSPINSLASSAPPPSTGRPRASTLQRLMGSSANSSSSSLLLSAPAASGAAGRSPYGVALGTRASSSTMSVREQGISVPLPNSFVHSSFVFPKTGPTPQQVAFLSSRESLGAYGYGPGVAAPPTASQIPGAAGPPAFVLEPGLPPGLAAPITTASPGLGPGAMSARGRTRSGSAASATSIGSPLARVVTLPPSPPSSPPPPPPPPPPHRTNEAVEPRDRLERIAVAGPDLGRSGPANSESEAYLPTEGGSSAPRLPPLELDFGSLSLAPTPPSSSPIPISPSPCPAPPIGGEYGVTIPAVGPARGSRPPDIVTCAPTPTASAAPSPRLCGPDTFAPAISDPVSAPAYEASHYSAGAREGAGVVGSASSPPTREEDDIKGG